MSEKKSANDYFKKKEPTEMEIVTRGEEIVPTPRMMETIKNSVAEPGLLGRWRLGKAESDAQVRKLKVVRDAEVEELERQAEAARRESEAFWRAKSVQMAETIKTYAQNKLNEMEAERADNRSVRTIEACRRATERVESILRDASLPEMLKETAITAVQKELEALLESIRTDSLARRHGLA